MNPAYVRNMFNRVSLNCDNAEHARREACNVDEFYRRVAAEIIIQSVEDWRWLVKHKKWDVATMTPCGSFDEIRQFFKGEWCAFIMQFFPVDPERILEMLEDELQEARAKEEERLRKKMKVKGCRE